MLIHLLAAIVMASAAQADAVHRPAHTVELSRAAAAAVRAFDRAIAAERAAYDAMPADTAVGPALATRVALEQAMRRAIDPAVDALPDADRAAATDAIWRRISQVDAANTTFVQSILPADGWFRSRRDGADVARNAWLIVQHSPDQAFQRTVVERMRPLVESGDARGSDYALLLDRTEMFAGRPQRYGSQMSCEAGRWQPAPIADSADLDARRKAIGLPPMAEYLKNFEGRC